MRRLRLPIVGAFLLLVAVVAAVLATRSGPAEAVVFRYAFSEGEVRSYDLSMDYELRPQASPAQPVTGRLRASLRMSVEEMHQDGSTVLELALQDISRDPALPGRSEEGGRLRLTIASDGRVLDVEGTGGVFTAAGIDPSVFFGLPRAGATDAAESQFLFPQYPDHPVEPGDEWSKTSAFPLPFGDQEATLNATGRLEGYEDSAYGRLARVGLTVRAPMDIDAPIAELMRAIGSDQVPDLPAFAEEARLVVEGRTLMDAETLVLPETSELVRFSGTTRMSMQMTFHGVPQETLGELADYAFDTTMNISIERVESP